MLSEGGSLGINTKHKRPVDIKRNIPLVDSLHGFVGFEKQCRSVIADTRVLI